MLRKLLPVFLGSLLVASFAATGVAMITGAVAATTILCITIGTAGFSVSIMMLALCLVQRARIGASGVIFLTTCSGVCAIAYPLLSFVMWSLAQTQA